MQKRKEQNNKSTFTAILLFVTVILLIIIGIYLNLPARLYSSAEWIENGGWWGILLFAALHLIGSIIAIPASIMALAGGFIFGLGRGIIIVSISSTVGATAAFLIARYLARDWIEGQIEKHPKFRIIDEAIAKEGWQVVGLIRLSPIIPYNILHFIFGLTRIKIHHYILASWIGMLPMTLIYVYAGSLASNLAQVTDKPYFAYSYRNWLFYILGFLLTLTVTLYITNLVRKELKKKLENVKIRDQ